MRQREWRPTVLRELLIVSVTRLRAIFIIVEKIINTRRFRDAFYLPLGEGAERMRGG